MRRIWAGEPPFAGADPVGPPPVQGASIPVIAGVMGPKAIARAAHWADGVDGAWTMDGDLDHMTRSFAQIRDVVGRRRAHRGAPPLVEHLVRARRRRRSPPEAVRVRLHEDDGRRCRRVGGGRGHVLHPGRVASGGRPRPRGGCRRVLPRPDHVGSRRAGAHARRARCLTPRWTSTACSRRSPREVGFDDYGDPTFRDGLDPLWASATKEADLNEIGMLAVEAQVRGNLANRLPRARVAPHPPRADRDAGRGAAHPRGHAPQRHDRAEPPAGGRPRQPFVARLGGQRVHPAADHRRLPGRSAIRGGARRAERRRPRQPGLQGHPPRRTRRRHGVHAAPRPALPEPHLLHHVQRAGLRRVAAGVRLGRCRAVPPARAAGAAVRVPGSLAVEVTAVRTAARLGVRNVSRRAA